MTIDRWIADAAAREPGRPALEFRGRIWSYAEFDARIAARAADLSARGVGRGDRVAWYGLNHPEAFVLLFAMARIGGALAPLNWRLAEPELAGILANCAPKLVVHDSHFEPDARKLAGPAALSVDAPLRDGDAPTAGFADDPVLIVHTSGSTGRPKGAVLEQSALEANAAMSVEAHGLCPDDRVLNVLPLFHVGGLNILPTPAFSIGASVELHERFDPEDMATALRTATHSVVVPTVLQALMSAKSWAGSEFSRLRALSIGSTDVPIELIEAVHACGVPVVQIYGATETAPLAIYQRVGEAFETVGSIGRAGSQCDIRLAGADGRDAADGEPGEILVKGPNVLKEYWQEPELTADALEEGWFRTGDIARRDANGLYWFVGRVEHVIISGGENIHPAEIERALRTHPEVREIAVAGRPDPEWGEVPVAVVVSDAEIGHRDVLDHLEGRIARYKRPRATLRVDSLPRNAMGKVVVEKLRELVAAGPLDISSGETDSSDGDAAARPAEAGCPGE